MIESRIKKPVSIVTNREIALISCLDIQFPESVHLLCCWYININVLAKTKKHFLGLVKSDDKKMKRHPLFKVFLKDWNTLLFSRTKASYNDLLKEITTKHTFLIMSYCEGTWLNLWKEKLVIY